MVYLTEPQDMCAGLRIGTGHHYAFATIEHLMGAIQSFIMLREYGFNISVYESNEHIFLPDGQVAFMRDQSKLIEAHPIHEFPFENYF